MKRWPVLTLILNILGLVAVQVCEVWRPGSVGAVMPLHIIWAFATAFCLVSGVRIRK